MSKAQDAFKRQKELAAKRDKKPAAKKPADSPAPLDDALQKPQSEYPNRMILLLSDDQKARVRRLAYEKNLRNVEVVRRMIDATPDEAV